MYVFLEHSMFKAVLMCSHLGQLIEEESLFYYGPGLSTRNYSNPDFTPNFKSTVVADASEVISTYCGGNAECIFDYSVSGRQDVAQSTLMANQKYTSMETKACKFLHGFVSLLYFSSPLASFPPRIYGNGFFEVTIGQTAVYNMTVLDGQLEVLGGLPPDSMLTKDNSTSSVYSFTWTLSNPIDTPITFVASNSMGGFAVHSPHIGICACANGGECTQAGILGTNNNIALFQCVCPEGRQYDLYKTTT